MTEPDLLESEMPEPEASLAAEILGSGDGEPDAPNDDDSTGRTLRAEAPDPRGHFVGTAMLVAGVVVVTVVVGIAVIAVLLLRREHDIRRQAQVLQARLKAAEQSLAPGQPGHVVDEKQRLAAARQSEIELSSSAEALRHSTEGLLWSATNWIPGLSRPMGATHSLATISSQIAEIAVPTYINTLATMSNQTVAGGLNLNGLASQQGALDNAQALVAALELQASAVPSTGVGSLDHAASELRSSLTRLDGYAQTLSVAAHVAPAMLGENGPRTNLVVLQTPSESRGTGGLVGGYVELRAVSGKTTVTSEGTNHKLRSSPDPVVTPDPQFQALYGTRAATTVWSDSNLSPDFSEVGAVWAGLYAYDFGHSVDGVVGVTPEVLSWILGVTGPVTGPDGVEITHDNAAYLLERDLYTRYPQPDQEDQRNAFQLAVLHAVVTRLLAYQGDPLPLLSALGHATALGQLRLYSGHAAEEAQLTRTPLGGALSSAPGPFFGVITVNDDGSKLDAYLRRHLSYRRAAVPGDPAHQRVTGTVTLTNEAPASGLPAYVTYRADLDAAQRATAVAGAHRVLVSVYLSTDAVLQQVLIDGKVVPATFTGRERNHLFVETAPGEILPGHSVTISVVGLEATSSAAPGTVVQATALQDD